MLLRIGTTQAGLLATGIPIVFGLRPDLNEEFTQINATDTTQGQLLGLQAQSAALQQQLAEQSQQLAEQSQQLIELTIFVNRHCCEAGARRKRILSAALVPTNEVSRHILSLSLEQPEFSNKVEKSALSSVSPLFSRLYFFLSAKLSSTRALDRNFAAGATAAHSTFAIAHTILLCCSSIVAAATDLASAVSITFAFAFANKVV